MVWEAVAGATVGAILGGASDRSNAKKSSELNYEQHKLIDKYDWKQAKKRGITPVEFYGSPAASTSGDSGASVTLGNQASKFADIGQTMAMQFKENEKDRDSNERIAAIQAGASEYATDKTYEANIKRLRFDKEMYYNTTVPQAAANIGKTIQETNKLVNEVATSDPKFQRFMKIMTMGIDNTIGLAIQTSLGVDVSDPKQMKNLPLEKKKQLMAGLLSAKSNLAAEMSGASQSVGSWLDSLANAMQKGVDYMFNSSPGIEQTTSTNKLGRKPGQRPYQ